jgi:hypothetical protein
MIIILGYAYIRKKKYHVLGRLIIMKGEIIIDNEIDRIGRKDRLDRYGSIMHPA